MDVSQATVQSRRFKEILTNTALIGVASLPGMVMVS